MGEKEEHNSAEYLHAVIEALRIAFADGHWWIGDGAKTEGLLKKVYPPLLTKN